MPLTLQQIIEEETEQTIIPDTCSYPTRLIDPENMRESSIKPARKFSEITAYENILATPIIIRELQEFRDIIKDKLKFLEKLKRRQNEYAGTAVREGCEFGRQIQGFIERGIGNLRKKLFDSKKSAPYQNLADIIALIDKIDLENQTGTPEKYKEITAMALLLSRFSNGAVIISDTSRLYNPILRWFRILKTPALRGNSKLTESFDKNPVVIYLKWESERGYICKMNSRDITALENLDFLNKDDKLCTFYIGHCLANLDRKFPYIQRKLEALASVPS